MRQVLPIVGRTLLLMLLVCRVSGVRADSTVDTSAELERARGLLQTGDVDEARKAYAAILENAVDSAEADRIVAAIGLSRAEQSRGLWEAAVKTIETALTLSPHDATLLGRQAELFFLRGDHESAAASVAASLEQDDEQLTARLIKSHLAAEQGQLKDASDGYRWFVRYYNRHQPTDAETLLLVGEGSLQYARWNGVSAIFNFVVNTLSVDALKDDPECWQASLMSGELLLEKFNAQQAKEEFAAALAINPTAAEVITALGRAALVDGKIGDALEYSKRALTINPRLPASLVLAADVSIAVGEFKTAMEFIERARAVNPIDQQVLARMAGIFLFDDGVPDRDVLNSLLAGDFDTVTEEERNSRFAKTYRNVLGRHSSPGVFLTEVGHLLDQHRQYAGAELCYRRAIEVMPQLASPRASLGMLAMRTGDLEEAGSILDTAFKKDPYHVRVSNMRKVLGELKEYDTVESDHFVIRIPTNERILGEAMSEYLEQTYDELTQQYGFEPETRTPFEVYGRSGGTSGHEWFSARMIGLPWVQTIGASTGMIVAMASPNDGDTPFNWARVVRHEFVHILTLQQTRFNIPHWYTEALAVTTEGVTPPEWDEMLLRRVPIGDVFTLNDINAGFQQPSSPEDWQMAYCQSYLYAKHITEQFGDEAHVKLLDAFRRNLSTPEAIEEVCGMGLTDFEAGYSDFLDETVAHLSETRVEPPLSVEAAQSRWRKNATDRNLQSQLAWAKWHNDQRREAYDIAEQILADTPEQPLAIAIVAESQLTDGSILVAEELLESVTNGDDPHPACLELLAQLRSAQEEWDVSRDLWQRLVDRWPREPRFLKGLAAVLVRTQDESGLRPILERLAMLDVDDLPSRKKLVKIAYAAGDWESAIRWGKEALHIDVMSRELHETLADVYDELGQHDTANRHRDISERIEVD